MALPERSSSSSDSAGAAVSVGAGVSEEETVSFTSDFSVFVFCIRRVIFSFTVMAVSELELSDAVPVWLPIGIRVSDSSVPSFSPDIVFPVSVTFSPVLSPAETGNIYKGSNREMHIATVNSIRIIFIAFFRNRCLPPLFFRNTQDPDLIELLFLRMLLAYV